MKNLLEKIEDILNEAIPISTYKRFHKESKSLGVDYKKRYAEIFGNDEKGRPKMRIYIPLGEKPRKTVFKPHEEIVDALKENGL